MLIVWRVCGDQDRDDGRSAEEQRRGTEPRQRDIAAAKDSRTAAQKNTNMRSGERGQKGQRKIERTAQISKMRRSQQHRKAETSSKVRLASWEPNMRLLAF